MPGTEADSIEIVLDGASTASRVVRTEFRRFLGASDRLDDVLLCLSEVVTNASLHGQPPIRVCGRRFGATVRVEVTDASRTLPVRQNPTSASPTGRGLLLLDRLTSEWGVEPEPAGKTVWFEFRRDQA